MHDIKFRGDGDSDIGGRNKDQCSHRNTELPLDDSMDKAGKRIFYEMHALFSENVPVNFIHPLIKNTPWNSTNPEIDDIEFRLGVLYEIIRNIEENLEATPDENKEALRIFLSMQTLVRETITTLEKYRPNKVNSIGASPQGYFPQILRFLSKWLFGIK